MQLYFTDNIARGLARNESNIMLLIKLKEQSKTIAELHQIINNLVTVQDCGLRKKLGLPEIACRIAS